MRKCVVHRFTVTTGMTTGQKYLVAQDWYILEGMWMRLPWSTQNSWVFDTKWNLDFFPGKFTTKWPTLAFFKMSVLQPRTQRPWMDWLRSTVRLCRHPMRKLQFPKWNGKSFHIDQRWEIEEDTSEKSLFLNFVVLAWHQYLPSRII